MDIERKKIEYDCEENDNTIITVIENSVFDEMQVGCKFAPSAGWIVIGVKDLYNALRKDGYEVRRIE